MRSSHSRSERHRPQRARWRLALMSSSAERRRSSTRVNTSYDRWFAILSPPSHEWDFLLVRLGLKHYSETARAASVKLPTLVPICGAIDGRVLDPELPAGLQPEAPVGYAGAFDRRTRVATGSASPPRTARG